MGALAVGKVGHDCQGGGLQGVVQTIPFGQQLGDDLSVDLDLLGEALVVGP
ncbi:hypothetical protein ACWC0C_46495 [Streptomyces sp. NPDC001709]